MDRNSPAERAKEERAESIMDQLQEIGKASDDAFRGIAYDPATGGVVVERVGQPPAAIAALYTKLATADVPVTISGNFKISDKMRRTVRDAIIRDKETLAAQDIDITAWASNRGGPLTISLKPGTLTPEKTEWILRRYGDAFYGRDTIAVNEEEADDPLVGRQSDYPPYWGGARMYSYGQTPPSGCTTGFGGYSTNGRHYLLGALHCSNLGAGASDRVVYNGDVQRIGTWNNWYDIMDVGFIGDGGGAVVDTDNWAYDGAWNSTWGKEVTAATNPSFNKSLCTSGSYSGIICGLTIRDSLPRSWNICNINSTHCYYAEGWPAGDVQNLFATSAGGKGDSGAPAWQVQTDGDVTAMGMVMIGSGAHAGRPCTGVATTCYGMIYISNIVEVQNAMNISVTSVP